MMFIDNIGNTHGIFSMQIARMCLSTYLMTIIYCILNMLRNPTFAEIFKTLHCYLLFL